MEKIIITDELHNELVKTFEARARNFGYTGKKFIKMQTEFFSGAIRALDILNTGSEGSCITPRIYFSLLRGDKVELISEPKTTHP